MIALGLAALAGCGAALAVAMRPRASAMEDPPAPAASRAPALSFHPANVRRLTFNGGCDELRAFTPDGRSVVFDETLDEDPFLVVMNLADRTTRRLTNPPTYDFQATVSPDGKTVAFRKSKKKALSGVYVTNLDGSGEPRLVAAGLYRPTFSRDGRSLWADDRSRIKRLEVETGAVLETLDPPAGMAPGRTSELEDGTLVAESPHYIDTPSGAVALYSPERRLKVLFTGNVEEALALTPDHRHALVSRVQAAAQPELVAVPLAGGAEVSLASGGVAPWRGMAVAPDGESMVWSTCHASVSMSVLRSDGTLTTLSSEDWNDNALAWVEGTSRIIVLSERGGHVAPWVVDRTGQTSPRRLDVVSDADDAIALAVSPDGTTLAVAIDQRGIYTTSLTGDAPARLLVSGAGYTGLSFFRDGATLLYTSRRDGRTGVVMQVAVAGGEPKPLLEKAADAVASPDGDLVAFLAGDSATASSPASTRSARRPRARSLPSSSPRTTSTPASRRTESA